MLVSVLAALTLDATLTPLAHPDTVRGPAPAPVATIDPTPEDDAARLAIVPGVGFAPETGFALTPSVVRFWRTGSGATTDGVATRPSSASLGLLASTRRQFALTFQYERWSPDNRTWLTAAAEASEVPQPFFGIGPVAPLANEELFTPRLATATFTAQRAFWRRPSLAALYLGAQVDVGTLAMRRTEAGGQLAPGTIAGSDGSTVVGAGPLATVDTRDDVVFTGAGRFVQAGWTLYPVALGSTYGFSRWTVDARAFRTFGARADTARATLPAELRGVPRTVLATQLTLDGSTGTTPFDQLPTFGGDGLKRGYLRGRYRDRSMVTAQVELRRQFTGFAPTWLPKRLHHRLGAAVFVAAGDVAPGFRAMQARNVNVTGGAGVRWLLLPRERLNVRIDYGVARDSRGLYFTVGEAF